MARNKTKDLLKVLGRRTPPGAPTPKPPVQNPSRPAHAKESIAKALSPQPPKATRARGKAIQFYLHEPDEKLIREFAVWLAPHRKRINDSLVIKAVLRAARTGPGLLAAYDEGLAVSEAHKGAKRPQEYL